MLKCREETFAFVNGRLDHVGVDPGRSCLDGNLGLDAINVAAVGIHALGARGELERGQERVHRPPDEDDDEAELDLEVAVHRIFRA